MLQSPAWVKSEAQRGFSAPTYAYARNNPVRYTDRNGKFVGVDDAVEVGILVEIAAAAWLVDQLFSDPVHGQLGDPVMHPPTQYRRPSYLPPLNGPRPAPNNGRIRNPVCANRTTTAEEQRCIQLATNWGIRALIEGMTNDRDRQREVATVWCECMQIYDWEACEEALADINWRFPY